RFAVAAAEKGEKSLLYIFDETVRTLASRAGQLKMDLAPFIENGLIVIEQVDPAEISPGELAHRIRESVDRHGVRLIVIDSINGYLNAMPAERYLTLQLHELLAYLNQQGIITI